MPRLAVACNEESSLVDAANEGVLSSEFAVVQKDGLLIPFGEYPNEVTGPDGRVMAGVQVVDRDAGLAMANEMNSWLGKARSLMLGRPVFVGHPYHPQKDQRASYPDKAARGWIKSIEVQEDGIKLVTAYNELGTGEVNDARFVYHSPEWRMAPVPGRRNAFRPVMLRSTGLTNCPNIPVPPISVSANEGEGDPPISLDLNKIVAALKEAGLIQEGDSETAILSAIGNAARDLQWAREAKEREARELELLKAKVSCEGANEMSREQLLGEIVNRWKAEEDAARQRGLELAAANEALAAANDAVRLERTARAELALEPLVKAGKVTGARRPEAVAALVEAANEAAFAEALQEFSRAAPALPTAPTMLAGLEGKGRVILAANEQSARSRDRSELLAACMAEITKCGAARPGDHDRAWTMASQRRPDLFKH